MSVLPDNNENRKAELLAKSRTSQHDEGYEYADYRGAKSGVIL